jgi:hypothetical protein
MSTVHPKADMGELSRYVRLVPGADTDVFPIFDSRQKQLRSGVWPATLTNGSRDDLRRGWIDSELVM